MIENLFGILDVFKQDDKKYYQVLILTEIVENSPQVNSKS